MKKNVYAIFLLVALLLSLLLHSLQYQKSSSDVDLLLSKIDELSSQVDQAEAKLETSKSQFLTESQALVTALENYELLLHRLTSKRDLHSFEVRKRAYDVSAVMTTDDVSFNVPQNGQVIISGNTFELSMSVKEPPILRSVELNEHFDIYRNFFEDIVYPAADIKKITADTFFIRYENLEVGDTFTIRLSNDMVSLLNMDGYTINVTIVDDFDRGADYMPTTIVKKRFTGGYEGEGTIEEYTFLEDSSCTVKVINTGASLKFKYHFPDQVMITHRTSEGDLASDDFEPYERLVLPKIIRLGETWEDIYFKKMITGVDIEIDTLLGPLKAIEVTTYDSDVSEYWSKKYYTKELGLVFNSYSGLEDVLVEVEVID